VHIEPVGTGVVEAGNEVANEPKVFVIVDPDAELDGDWNDLSTIFPSSQRGRGRGYMRNVRR